MKHIVLILFVMLLFSCNKSSDMSRHVTVSVAPLKWVVEQIADSLVSVDVIVSESASAENFDPTAKQIAQISQSDIYFSTGLLGFERGIRDNIDAVSSKVEIVELKDYVDVIREQCHHCHNCGDPHIWLSVINMRCIAGKVFEELCNMYPEYISVFESRYENIDSELSQMHHYFSELFTGREKVLIVHPSLSYMERDYSFKQIPVEVDGKEPSASYIKEIIDVIEHDSISVIYYSIQDNPVIAKTISSEAGIDIMEFDPLAEDWKTEINKLVEDICRRF